METIDISKLSVDQLAAIKKQLKAQKKEKSKGRSTWVATVDKMLQEKDGNSFKHTTADILQALQTAKVWDGTEREVELKKVQTRKQLLEKKPEFKDKVGYKASAHGFAVNVDRVIAWVTTASADELQQVVGAIAKVRPNVKK